MRFAWVPLVLILAGCGSDGGNKPAATQSADDGLTQPVEQDLAGQIRSGLVQIEASADSVSEAHREVVAKRDAATGEVASALGEVADLVDSAGAGLVELVAEPPDPADVRSKPTKYESERKRLIAAVEDCLYDLREAVGILESLVENQANLAELRDLVGLARDDVAEALEALGGVAPAPEAA